MSHNKFCSKCKCSAKDCGCDSPLFTTVVDYSTNCPNPQTCDEFVSTSCVLYSGPDIPLYNITTGMSLNEVLGKLLIAIVDPDCILQTPTPDCEAVSYLSIINVTKTTITIGWPLVSAGLNYTVSYRAGGSGSFTALPIQSGSTVSYQITGLTADTSYDIYVTTACTSGGCNSSIIRLSTLS